MSIVTISSMAHAGPVARQSGPAAAADAGEIDFAGLLSAGIGRKPVTTPVPDSTEVAKDPKSDADKDAVACDPASLLDAIAAGQVVIDPKHVALPAVPVAAPQLLPNAVIDDNAGGLPADPDGATATRVSTRPGTKTTAVRPDGGKTAADAGTQKPEDTQRATDVRRDADTASKTSPAQTVQPPPATITTLKPETSEHRQETSVPSLSAGGNTVGITNAAQTSHAPAITAMVAHMEQLAQPLGTPGWDDGFSSHIVWMAKNDVQSASIRLNPPDLGPVEIKLTLTNDQGAQTSASVQFSAAHAATREAIESALPRLREMLQENGIALGNTSVDAGTAGHTNDSDGSGRHSPGNSSREGHAGQVPETGIQPRAGNPLRRGNGLVDTFA